MIRVNNDYVIDIDKFNYIVKRDRHRRTVKKDPLRLTYIEVNEYSEVGYFDNLTGAIKGVIEDMNKRDLSRRTVTLLEAVEIVLNNNRQVSDLLERALEV